ncbi:MAG: Rrf2 family transcriptional regulator [Elusimicrobia bacterium]|nr:Rrf2 family transcriptional regulator [Elusimicrobiota bacterium]
MKISSAQEYGLRCILQVAVAKGRPVDIGAVAQAEGLSTAYVGKLMFLLRKAKLLKSLRGPKGGYVLSAAPKEITMSLVMAALATHPKNDLEVCRQFPGEKKECVHMSGVCSIRSVWHAIYQEIWRVLNSVTLEDLLNKTSITMNTDVMAALKASSAMSPGNAPGAGDNSKQEGKELNHDLA